MISPADQELLRQRFARDLTSRLRIDIFTQKPSPIIIPGRPECPFCEDVATLFTEIASLSDRISLNVHDFYADPKAAEALGVDGIPATVFSGARNRRMRFFGIPTGAMFTPFLETLIDVARGDEGLQPESVRQLKKIRDEVILQVLLTPVCEHSPAVARTAFRIAQQNPKVKVDVIEVTEFPAFIQVYGIQATPVVVIDVGREAPLVLAGAMDEATLVDCLLRAVAGRPVANSAPHGPTTPLMQPQSQEIRAAGSGLIIPR
jgi:glutaredoxin-like protein